MVNICILTPGITVLYSSCISMGWVIMQRKLEKFEEHLRKLNLVNDRQSPCMLRLVRNHLFLGRPEEAVYADVLEKEGKQDWQIRQALDAMKLYRQYSGDSEKDRDGATPEDPIEILIEKLRIRHYSRSTVRTYSSWSRKYLNFCSARDLKPEEDASFVAYLSLLALKEHVASSTQNQAFNAILFLFRNVWRREPEGIDAVRARKPKRFPVVLTHEEVAAILDRTSGRQGLILRIIYASGLRLNEALSLRVQDLDLENESLMVRGGKGDKDRVTLLSRQLVPELKEHLAALKSAFVKADVPVSLPSALERKYPNAGLEWKWQYIFPSRGPSIDPESGEVRRHHLHSSIIQRAMRKAVQLAGVDLCEIQELLGHKSLETTRIYLHVMKGMKNSVESPLAQLVRKIT